MTEKIPFVINFLPRKFTGKSCNDFPAIMSVNMDKINAVIIDISSDKSH